MGITIIHLFNIDENKTMSLVKSSGIVFDKENFTLETDNMVTKLQINFIDDQEMADILMVLKPYLISTDGKDIFEVVATYLDVFHKSLILFDNGTSGILTSKLLCNLDNQDLVKSSYTINSVTQLQKLFDLSPAETTEIALATEVNICKIARKIQERNISDYVVCTFSNFQEPQTAEAKVFQPKGKSLVLIASGSGKDYKTYKFQGDSYNIAYSTAQVAAWTLLQKLKYGQ